MGQRFRIIIILGILALTTAVRALDDADINPLLEENWDKSSPKWREAVDNGELGPEDVAKNGTTALMAFAWKDDVEYMAKLLDAGADINATNRNGVTALHYCAQYNCVRAGKFLIDHGANLNIQGRVVGFTPLTLACEYDKPEMVALLLAAKADIHIPARFGPPLVYASGNKGVVRQLLDAGADINAHEEKTGNTPLIYIMSTAGNLQAARILMDSGANLDTTNWAGRTAFLEALANGHFEAAEALLDAKADWRIKDAEGNSAIFLAANVPSPNLVQRLEKLGANTNEIHLRDLKLSQINDSQRRWAYAVTAFQVMVEHIDFKLLDEPPPRGSLQFDLLKNKPVFWWQAKTKKQAMETLEDFKNDTASAEFAKIAKAVGGLSEADFKQQQDELLISDPHLRKQRKVVHEYLAHGGHHDLTGWESARYIYFVLLCRAAHYLSEDECWNLIKPRLTSLQAQFASWADFAGNVCVGYAFTSPVADPSYQLIEQMLLNKDDAASPWNQVNWKQPLSRSGK